MSVQIRAEHPLARRAARTLACFALAACLGVSLARAQSPAPLVLDYQFGNPPPPQPKVVFVPSPLAGPPELAGDLSDLCWKSCASLDIESDMPGGVPSRRTQAFVCWGGDTLYVAFRCQEPAVADLPLLPQPLHGVRSPENVQVWIAPAADEQDYFLFETDPNGSTYERRGSGAPWTPAWTARAARSGEGWTAELAIPLKTFRAGAPKTGDTWRINLCRDIATTGEQCSWAGTMGDRANPAAWGLLFFGDAGAFARRVVQPRATLYAACRLLGPHDRLLRAVVCIAPGSASLGAMTLRASLAPARNTTALPSLPAPSAIPVQGRRAGLLLDVAGLPAGDFILRAELLDAHGKTLADSETPLKKPEPPVEAELSPRKLQIRVLPVAVKAKAAASWPVSAGVALPAGALFSPENIRLLAADGREVPCRALVRSRWPGDSSIRWLGLDFRADIAAAGGRTFTLEYGPGVSPAVVRGFTKKIQALKMEVGEEAWIVDTGDAWWVNTGALLFNINYKKFSGIMGAWVDVAGDGLYDWTGQILNAESAAAGPYIVDSLGRVYRLAADPDATVQLEEYDEMRAVFLVQGRLAPVSGPPAMDMGRCILRVTAYYGRPYLRLQCAYVFNERAAHTLLSDVGIMEKLYFNSRFDAVFGTEPLFRRPIQSTGAVYLLDLFPDRFFLRSVQAPPAINLAPAAAEDWGAAAASDRGLAVAVRDMGFLHPKEIEFTPENQLLIHFWPAHGSENERALKTEVNRRTVGNLGFAASGRMLDLRVPAAFAGALKDQDGLTDFDAARDMDISDPTGVAFTYDVFYDFFKGPFDPDETAGIARAFELSPGGVQDPQSLAASGVLRETLPAARLDRASSMLARLLAFEAQNPADGDVNFMDVRRTWLPDEERWRLRNYWMAATDDLPGALWLLYLQTGRPEVLLAARSNLRHIISMDICHDATPALTLLADPRRRKIVGAFSKAATPVHWQSVCSVSDRHARIRALLLSYDLTGNLLARDAALLWAGAAEDYGPPTTGEDGLSYLTNLSEILSLVYDPALLSRFGTCADYLFQTPLDLSAAKEWVPGLRAYFAASGDPRAAAWLRPLGKALLADPASLALRDLGLWRDLYSVTGDDTYSSQAEKITEAFEKRVDAAAGSQDAPPFSWEDFCSYVFNAADPVPFLGTAGAN